MVKGSSLVDRAWTCGCGSLNSAYNKECGKCNTIKPTGNWDQIIKKQIVMNQQVHLRLIIANGVVKKHQ